MYDLLIPLVIEEFSAPDQTERSFLETVQQADIRLVEHFRTRKAVTPKIYSDPLIRAAYLLRYLGHYTLQLGDLLNDLEGTAAAAVLALPELRLAALCGGPCPEAIALATLHRQGGGRRLQADVMDLHAHAWADCWPITTRIISNYPVHPEVCIKGVAIDLCQPTLPLPERNVLDAAQVFTTMNCLNELVGLDAEKLQQGLAMRLDALAPGTLVFASDQASYSDCARGLGMLHELLQQRGASILLAELDPNHPHVAQNRFETPERIAWIYGPENQNIFRIWTKQLRLAAVMD